MAALFSRPQKQFLDAAQQQQVMTCIAEAENRTSGEIRVFMEPHCKWVSAVDRAREVFLQLGMEKTSMHNAVIIYIAWEDRQFALYGDKAIFEKAGGALFWQQAAATLGQHLRQQDYTNGLCACVRQLGDALATHFPPDTNIKRNELPDEIVFGK